MTRDICEVHALTTTRHVCVLYVVLVQVVTGGGVYFLANSNLISSSTSKRVVWKRQK